MKGKITTIRTYYKYNTQTFNASSEFQTFTVPEGVKKILIDCVASKGMDGTTRSGGNGGRVQCALSVTPSSTFYIFVGAIQSTNGHIPTYNASDIRTDNTGITDSTSLNSRIVVAGGGGNAGIGTYGAGAGGGLIGGDGEGKRYSGEGGTQSAGGAGYNSGTFGLGGTGRVRGFEWSGAGGAGWYGGGSGYNYTGSGGGGSSYTDYTCFNVVHTQGYNSGTGYIAISYPVISTESDYDFYEDSYEVKVVEVEESDDTKFYGIKEYKRGQYYGN